MWVLGGNVIPEEAKPSREVGFILGKGVLLRPSHPPSLLSCDELETGSGISS